jgi:hypothetical protein
VARRFEQALCRKVPRRQQEGLHARPRRVISVVIPHLLRDRLYNVTPDLFRGLLFLLCHPERNAVGVKSKDPVTFQKDCPRAVLFLYGGGGIPLVRTSLLSTLSSGCSDAAPATPGLPRPPALKCKIPQP